MQLFSWFTAHSHDMLELLGLLVAAATLVVKLTKTPADDAALSRLTGLLRRFSLLGYRDEVRAVYVPKEAPLLARRLDG